MKINNRMFKVMIPMLVIQAMMMCGCGKANKQEAADLKITWNDQESEKETENAEEIKTESVSNTNDAESAVIVGNSEEKTEEQNIEEQIGEADITVPDMTEWIKKAEMGDEYTLGHWAKADTPKDTKPIRWVAVLKDDEGVVFVSKDYMNADPDVTDGTTTVDAWIEEFNSKAFNGDERKQISGEAYILSEKDINTIKEENTGFDYSVPAGSDLEEGIRLAIRING